MVQLLQISDTHLFAEQDQVLLGVPTYATLQLVVADAQQRYAGAAACLLTGDLAQDGSRQGYQHLIQCLAPLDMPKYALPGNHDDLQLSQQILQAAGIGFIKSFECAGWYIILLNSVAPDGGHHGLLAEDELARLDTELTAHARQPCLVAVHHPAVRLDSAWIDELRLHNSDAMFSILDRHPQVRSVLWGHAHQVYQGQRNGVTLLGAPSTCVQFQPLSETFQADDLHPGYRVITLKDNGEFDTEVQRVTEFPYEVLGKKVGYR